MIVILSFFHSKIGTKIFYSYPQIPLEKEISDRLDYIISHNEEEFLTHSFENFNLLNYSYQIKSDWARGWKEMLMVSIMTNQHVSPEIEGIIADLCKKFAKKMQMVENIYTGFYLEEINYYDNEDKDLIIKNEHLIKEWVSDLYWEILEDTKKKTEEQNITLMLNDRYIFESLEKMSRELKKISKEINLSKDSLRKNSNIKNSISSLNKLIDDLSNGYIEKMTDLDIEIEHGLFLEEEQNQDNEKRKKDLIGVLKEEINGD